MKTWLQSLFNRFKKRKQSSRAERTVVEDRVINHVKSIVMTACAEFGRSGYAGRCFINNDMSKRMSVLMYRIENHLYEDLGKRIKLGNTTMCGGTIRTLSTGKDVSGYPRAQYKLQLPLYGRVIFEYGAKAVVSGKTTTIRPCARIIISAFDVIELTELSKLIYLEVRDTVDTKIVGW